MGSAREATQRALKQSGLSLRLNGTPWWHSNVWRSDRFRTKSMYCSSSTTSPAISHSFAETWGGKLLSTIVWNLASARYCSPWRAACSTN